MSLPILVRKQMLRVFFFIVASQYAAVWTTHLGFLAGFDDVEYTEMFYTPIISFFTSCFIAILFYLTRNYLFFSSFILLIFIFVFRYS